MSVEAHFGDSPLVLGLPHTGTHVPPDIAARLNARGQALADTDWHIHQLYDGLAEGASSVRASFHRYVIDANRDPGGQSLYPGQNTTGLCPTTDFDGLPIYRDGAGPTAEEVAARAQKFHAPYHAALAEALARAKARHGFAVLYDCHSIRSEIPFLFAGVLPDFNIGTNLGTTCAASIEAGVLARCKATGRSQVLNGRFKGGWTTRHYGQPAQGIHAIQMELAQSTYLAAEAPPWTYDAARATRLRAQLSDILTFLSHWRPQ
ncbi:N-formylglutamate deformylase [Abyssibius alkaniclasticus]|uniref:N-formylglutamate deformylase n=1 Tax=Abyssibius alkaniclasticus TaxID=2881234 RepID=UPI004059AFA2